MNQYYIVLIVIYYCVYKTVQCALLPSDIKKCRFGDSACIIKSINDLIRRYPNGIPEIGLSPLNVIKLKDMPFLNSPYRGPIWLTFHTRNYVSRGFSNATVTHVEGFNRDPTKEQLVIKVHIPSLVDEATYDMEGQVMLFKANTTGRLQSDFQNFQLTLIFKIILEYRYNKRYLKIYNLVPLISIDRWIIWLDDLYRENSDLTIALNRVFNDNWVEFWNDLEPGLLNAFGVSFSSMLNRVFKNVSYDDMFLS